MYLEKSKRLKGTVVILHVRTIFIFDKNFIYNYKLFFNLKLLLSCFSLLFRRHLVVCGCVISSGVKSRRNFNVHIQAVKSQAECYITKSRVVSFETIR